MRHVRIALANFRFPATPNESIALTVQAVADAAGHGAEVVFCHEGWRYPETVRWAAQRGAQVILHPRFHEAEPEASGTTA